MKGNRTAATYNFLRISLAALAAGWFMALRALTELGAWALLAGIGFLVIVGLGVCRAARI